MQLATIGEVQAQAKKRNPTVMPDRVGLAEHKRKDWVADVELGTTLEDIQNPAFWSMVSKDFDPFDTIEVRVDDGKWIAHLRVISCERTYAKVQLLRVEEIGGNAEGSPISAKHKVAWKGPHLRFAVIRLSDDAMLQSGYKTREEAETWLRNYERNI